LACRVWIDDACGAKKGAKNGIIEYGCIYSKTNSTERAEGDDGLSSTGIKDSLGVGFGSEEVWFKVDLSEEGVPRN
jgi:hypothetical protein